MKKAILLLTLLSLSIISLQAAKVYYTSGEGRGMWSDLNSWVLAGTNETPTMAPTAEDHVVISHYLAHYINESYVHYGDIEIRANGIYELTRSLTREATYHFAGAHMDVVGTLFSAVHLSVEEDALLIIQRTASVYLNGNLSLTGDQGIISEVNSCGAVVINGDLSLVSSTAFLTGGSSTVVMGHVRLWDDGGQEMSEDEDWSVLLASRLGAQTNLYASSEACGEQLPMIEGNATELQPGTDWAAFEAEGVAQEAQLVWYTDHERFVQDFTVERSYDGVSFEAIEYLTARGQGGLGNTYHYTDHIPAHLTVTYRIRQNTISGTYTYSPSRQITQSAERQAFTVFPNPSRNHRVQIQGEGLAIGATAQLEVRDISGHLVHQARMTVDYNGRVDVQGLPGLSPGMYLVVLQQGEARMVERLKIY